MRLVFAVLVIIHGLIHLMGFTKAYKILEINQLSQEILKPIGLLWLLGAVLLTLSAILYLLKIDWWFVLAIIGVLISQVLIILFWQDAKFGTIANVIILLVALSAYGNYSFKTMVRSESNNLIKHLRFNNLPITNTDISHLPYIVQKWVKNSGAIGKERVASVRLRQTGEMRIKPTGKWMSFSAKQYIDSIASSFIWTTQVDMMPFIKIVGRDKLTNGIGDTLIKLLALIPIVHEADNEKINTGAMIRYLAEICWFPSAAIASNIFWESIGPTSSKAILTINNKSVSGHFKFNSNGDFCSFESDRYFGGDELARLEKWVVEAEDYKWFNGIKIPNKCKVTWKLDKGDFKWLKLNVTDIEYNIDELYKV